MDQGTRLRKVDAPAAMPVSIADVRAAHSRISNAIVRTPTLRSRTLSEMIGADV